MPRILQEPGYQYNRKGWNVQHPQACSDRKSAPDLVGCTATFCFGLQYRQRVLRINPDLAPRIIPADLHGSLENRADSKDAPQFVRSNAGQSHRRVASARRTIRRASKLAGSNLRLQIRRKCLRRLREYALLGSFIIERALPFFEFWKDAIDTVDAGGNLTIQPGDLPQWID